LNRICLVEKSSEIPQGSVVIRITRIREKTREPFSLCSHFLAFDGLRGGASSKAKKRKFRTPLQTPGLRIYALSSALLRDSPLRHALR
jgi:DNA-binding GntR family transcriptional regulator